MQVIDHQSSVNRCIRFRASEDQLLTEIMKRRSCNGYALHVPCRCGSFSYVLPNMMTRDAECEQCFAKRRYKELTGC